MIKGAQKQIIVVKTSASRYFEEAYFVLKNDVTTKKRNRTDLLTEARQIATKRMVDEAKALGADAVVNIRYGSSAVMQGVAEMIAYGTAVRFK